MITQIHVTFKLPNGTLASLLQTCSEDITSNFFIEAVKLHPATVSISTVEETDKVIFRKE